MQIRFGVIKISFKSIAFACSNIKRFVCMSEYCSTLSMSSGIVHCERGAGCESLASDPYVMIASNGKNAFLQLPSSLLSLLPPSSRSPLMPRAIFFCRSLHFSFIIFNGCFVRRLTFYCYLMKWVWFLLIH